MVHTYVSKDDICISVNATIQRSKTFDLFELLEIGDSPEDYFYNNFEELDDDIEVDDVETSIMVSGVVSHVQYEKDIERLNAMITQQAKTITDNKETIDSYCHVLNKLEKELFKQKQMSELDLKGGE